MKRLLIFTAAAMVAVVPAAVGLANNGSLSPTVSVVAPTQAVVDDHGGRVDRDTRTEQGDDRGSDDPTATPAPVVPAAPAPSASRSSEAIDDHGGLIDRDDRVETGDDRDQAPSTTDDAGNHGGAADDGHRHGGGADDGSRHDAGADDGGHGSDD